MQRQPYDTKPLSHAVVHPPAAAAAVDPGVLAVTVNNIL
jgi:hypothetical protein